MCSVAVSRSSSSTAVQVELPDRWIDTWGDHGSIESVYSHRARVSEALCVKWFVQNVYKPSWVKAESVHFSTVIERSFGNSLQNLCP